MTPYLADPDVTLYHGDCLEVLRTLPDRSVHMCATSPPFYGLRDYGTGEWEGGNTDCDHKPRAASRAERPAGGLTGGKATLDAATIQAGACHCGARRVDQQIGLEETPDQWVERLVAVFREVRRVLRDDGTLWVEIGDSYGSSGGDTKSGFNARYFDKPEWGLGKQGAPGGLLAETRRHPTKPKDLLGQPWLLAFALRADGWYLRSEIIWAKANPMPESVTDRPTKAHSTVFLLSKRPRYFYDADAIREDVKPTSGLRQAPSKHESNRNGKGYVQRDVAFDATCGANARSVWTIPTEPTPFAHFATWPRKLVTRMILAGTSERGCCPECGAPWVRETSSELAPTDRNPPPNGGELRGMTRAGNRTADGWVPNRDKTVTTLGWSPSCAHHHDPVPCTVLDPFAGSGTTLLVARHHGRHSIGIELNPAYCRLAAERLQQLSLLAEGAA